MMKRKYLFIITTLFSVLLLIAFTSTIILIINRSKSYHIYNERFTLKYFDNTPVDKEPDGVDIHNNRVLSMDINPLSNNWLVITTLKLPDDISGEKVTYKYVTHIRYTLSGLFSKEPELVEVTFFDSTISDVKILEDYRAKKLNFILGDYNFIQEYFKKINNKEKALSENYFPPVIEFGNDTYEELGITYITSTQGLKLLVGGDINTKEIDLTNYIPKGYEEYYLLNIEKNKLLVCAEKPDEKKCFILNIPNFNIEFEKVVTENWGYVFLSPDAEGLFIIRTDESNNPLGEIIYLDQYKEEKKYFIDNSRPKIFYDKESNVLTFKTIDLSKNLLEIDLFNK